MSNSSINNGNTTINGKKIKRIIKKIWFWSILRYININGTITAYQKYVYYQDSKDKIGTCLLSLSTCLSIFKIVFFVDWKGGGGF